MIVLGYFDAALFYLPLKAAVIPFDIGTPVLMPVNHSNIVSVYLLYHLVAFELLKSLFKYMSY